TENRLKIEAEEARLITVLKIPTNEVDHHLNLIHEKMNENKASEDEIRFYKLSRNKRRANWFTNILAPLEEIAALRGGRMIGLWKEAYALSKKVEFMKKTQLDQDRTEMEVQLELMGRDPSEAESRTSAREEEIIEGERIINEVFAELYPDVVEVVGEGQTIINREKLEDILEFKK
ncbi:MAG: hypothetical protein AAB855_04940, partial [Patescibacteria group bacterium]